MFRQTDDPEPILWKSASAIIVSIVVCSLISSIVAIFMGLVNSFFYDNQSLNDIWEQLVGGAFGVYVARLTCDRFFTPYSRHVVFVLLVLTMLAAASSEDYFFFKTRWLMVTHAANVISITIAAYILFWRGEKIHDWS